VPTLGRLIGLAARQYPLARNTAMRFLEPLGAATDPVPPPAPSSPAPPRINLVGVSVVLAGHHVLEDVHVVLAPGEHVAVVGPSGAGKSTLAGLLLGWHVPAAGQVLIDGRPLEGAVLASLRAGLAWVDPTVQLWNTSLRENAAYGNPPPSEEGLAGVMSAVTLDGVLAGLAHGESIGEGGRLLSGGEGQRLRLARAMIRPEVRLVVLDEAFGGLDRASRGALLSRARAHWSAATLICITHDIEETTGFQRVLVIEGGRVVEDGSPAVLAKQPGSRYGAMLDADMDVSNERWGDPVWERWRLVDGSLT
jgi:ATP-binding cassette subfamily B protein